MPKSKLFYLSAGLAVYLLTAGLSFWVFSYFRPHVSSTPISSASTTPAHSVTLSLKSKLDPSLPKTEVCPLNGDLFTAPEKAAWIKQRPLAVMIENSVDARPQSGLGFADVVYEAVAEGGITRFMALFYCNAALADHLTVAPVRSARIYFVNLVSEYDALYTHVGGAGNCDDPNVDERAKALCAIQRFKIKDMDEMGRAGDFKTCHRLTDRLDHDVAMEHTMACWLDTLYTAGAKWGWTNVDEKGVAWDINFVPWKFKTAADKTTGSPATSISYMFWGSVNRQFQSSYDVSWAYSAATNSYTRSNGGTVSTDLNTKQPLVFKDVVVEFAAETSTGDLEGHMLYAVIGTGKAIIFQDGIAVPATWSKLTRTSRTIFKDASGKEIKFNPGPMWISIVPSGNTITYQ